MIKASVAMCTYNGELYVREQLISIVNQTRKVDEIVIVDDCSKDMTVSICENILKETDIAYKILVNETNLRAGRSFEKAIIHCTGDVIFTSDQDDVWHENKIEKMMNIFEKNEKCVLCFSDSELVDAQLNVLNDSSWDALCFEQFGLHGSKTTQEEFIRAIMYQTVVFGNVMGFRKTMADKIFPMPQDKGWLHDNWVAVCAPIFGEVIMLEEKLVKYRQHGNNVCGIKNNRNNIAEKNAYHMQRLLLYIRQNEDKLKIFLEEMKEEISEDYKNFVLEYIKTYSEMKTYRDSSNAYKLLYVFSLLFRKNIKEKFNISNKNVVMYIKSYVKK